MLWVAEGRNPVKTWQMSVLRPFGAVLALALLAGCGLPLFQPTPQDAPPQDASGPSMEDASGTPLPAAPPPTARTAEQFDTTSAADRAAVVEAAAEPVSQARALGTTVVSLGDPADPGFWLKTPLVESEQPGRVEFADAGTKVALTLIPIDGPQTGGSRLSLPAMRLLEIPLTSLSEVTVFATE